MLTLYRIKVLGSYKTRSVSKDFGGPYLGQGLRKVELKFCSRDMSQGTACSGHVCDFQNSKCWMTQINKVQIIDACTM